MSDTHLLDPIPPADPLGSVVERLVLFLRDYLDGGVHSFGDDATLQNITFPLCEIVFNDIAPPPLRPDGSGDPPAAVPRVHLVHLRSEQTQHAWDAHRWLVRDEQLWNLHVSLEKRDEQDRKANTNARKACTLVNLLFSHNQTRLELARRHLHRPEILSGPVPLAFTGRAAFLSVLRLVPEWVVAG